MGLPTLIVISGPPGSGKTTLAHELARRVGCPAVCRDEIKEGMAHANPGFVPAPGDALTMRTLPTFFGAIELLLRAGVTTVAEAAFQDRVWRGGLEPLIPLARLRIVRCRVDAEVARRRRLLRGEQQPTRRAHADSGPVVAPSAFAELTLAAPSITVDTTDGCRPELAELVAFVDGGDVGTVTP